MARAEVISIGSELVLGGTLETNGHWLARRLTRLGIEVMRRTTVGDEEGMIVDALRAAAERAEVVITTGGLGPTRDDLTRRAIASACGTHLTIDRSAREWMSAHFHRLGRTMSPSNETQALIPLGGRAIPNELGTAPGIEVRLGQARLFALPGVPGEMRVMFEKWVAPKLQGIAGGKVLLERHLLCFGAGESVVGERIGELMDPGRRPRVNTTVADGIITVRILAEGNNPQEAKDRAAAVEAELRKRLGHLVFGTDDDTLEAVVGRMLIERGLTLAVAESCTGGLVADRLTNVAGISASLREGIVAYSNEAKQRLLGVPGDLIARVGAVSEEVARSMAEGARHRAGTDLGVSTTGIAGPSGGTPTKPVGLVYIGLAETNKTTVKRFLFHGSRQQIKDRAAKSALNLLRFYLSGAPLDI